MKTKIFGTNGQEGKEIELPMVFSAPIREDIVAKVLEASKTRQPHSPSPVAGKQHSASGKIRHARRKWRTAYGKGISRVPRKIMSRRGSQFNWVGAEISSARGGRRAHPPKVIAMINTNKINKKEIKVALYSAIASTANVKVVSKKYQTLSEKDIKELPIVVESKFLALKTKNAIENIKKIVGEKVFKVISAKKTVRSGKGKMRGRQYKSNAGAIFVVGEKETTKIGLFDVRNVKNLSVNDLAKGGQGRIVFYTEEAIKELGEQIRK